MQEHETPQQVGQTPSKQVDAQTFQTFYQENVSRIYYYVHGTLRNREEAEDLTAQIFLKALREIDQRRGSLTMQKWLFQVMRTMLSDYFRARSHVSLYSLEALLATGWDRSTEEFTTASSTAANRVQRLLQALPQQYREILTCRFLLNLSIRETALKMGVTETNVKVLQFRALKRAATLEYVLTD